MKWPELARGLRIEVRAREFFVAVRCAVEGLFGVLVFYEYAGMMSVTGFIVVRCKQSQEAGSRVVIDTTSFVAA